MKNLSKSKKIIYFRYNLKLNETIHMPIKDSKIIEAFSEKGQIELVPGGCSYNTMRVLNVFFCFLILNLNKNLVDDQPF